MVKKASSGVPQEITLRGKPVVIVLSTDQYVKLKHPKQKLVSFLRQSPIAGKDIELNRDKRQPL